MEQYLLSFLLAKRISAVNNSKDIHFQLGSEKKSEWRTQKKITALHFETQVVFSNPVSESSIHPAASHSCTTEIIHFHLQGPSKFQHCDRYTSTCTLHMKFQFLIPNTGNVVFHHKAAGLSPSTTRERTGLQESMLI